MQNHDVIAVKRHFCQMIFNNSTASCPVQLPCVHPGIVTGAPHMRTTILVVLHFPGDMQKSENTASLTKYNQEQHENHPFDLCHSCTIGSPTSAHHLQPKPLRCHGGPRGPVPGIRPSTVPTPLVLPLLDLSPLKASDKSGKGLVEMNELTEVDETGISFMFKP